jgi:hypothetical protein
VARPLEPLWGNEVRLSAGTAIGFEGRRGDRPSAAGIDGEDGWVVAGAA